MKHIYLLLFAFILIFSCKKDNSSPTSPLYAKWYYTADTFRYYTYNILDSIVPNNLLKYNHTDYLQINNNETCTSYRYGAVDNFNYYLVTPDSIIFVEKGGVVDDFSDTKIDTVNTNMLKLLYNIPSGYNLTTETAYFTK